MCSSHESYQICKVKITVILAHCGAHSCHIYASEPHSPFSESGVVEPPLEGRLIPAEHHHKNQHGKVKSFEQV